MKKATLFEFNGEKYRIVSTFGNIINAKKIKPTGRTKMFQPCIVFKLIKNKLYLFDVYNQKLVFNR